MVWDIPSRVNKSSHRPQTKSHGKWHPANSFQDISPEQSSGPTNWPPDNDTFTCSLNSFLPDDTALVTVVPLHVEVTVVSNGKDMGRHFTNLLVGVEANLVSCVDGQQLVRVHGHQDGTSVCLCIKEKDRAFKGRCDVTAGVVEVFRSFKLETNLKTSWNKTDKRLFPPTCSHYLSLWQLGKSINFRTE